MLVTLLPMVTLVRLVQPEKAPSPMLVTLSGIVMLVRLRSHRKRFADAGDRFLDGGGMLRLPATFLRTPVISIYQFVTYIRVRIGM